MNVSSCSCQTDGARMIDPDDPLDLERVDTVRQDATATLGVFFDPRIVDRVSDCIVTKVIDGVVGDGIVYRDLVRDSGVPSWATHTGLLGPILALVSLGSYKRDGVLLSALTRATRDRVPPTDEFCLMLERLGLVSSRASREECLEMWDHHWKKVISHVESRSRNGPGRT